MTLFSPKPTEEQEKALSLFRSGKNLKINAYAGAGKTSTLRMLAEARSGKPLYTAFNQDIAERSKSVFPDHVTCRTTHSIAREFVMKRWGFVQSRMGDSAKPGEIAAFLNLPDHTQLDIPFRKPLRAIELADLVQIAVNNFLNSADAELRARHVCQHDEFSSLESDLQEQVARVILPHARKLWEAMTTVKGAVPLGYSGYYKLWSLESSDLGYDCIFLDEAQDSNPPLLEVLNRQNCQIVYVGDPFQQIYSWRGAVNAMTEMRTDCTATLTTCFRFGEPIAEAAFQVIRPLGATDPLQGNPEKAGRIGFVEQPNCVITRTNMALFSELFRREEMIHRCSLGKKQKESLELQLQDVRLLKQGKQAFSDELRGYRSWEDVGHHVELGSNQQLRSFYRLVDTYGEERLLRLIKRTSSSRDRMAIHFTTAHRSKGQQWDRVVVNEDFCSRLIPESQNGKPTQTQRKQQEEQWREDVRLFYVALTRAEYEVQLPDALKTYFGIDGSRGEPGYGFTSSVSATAVGISVDVQGGKETIPAALDFSVRSSNTPTYKFFENLTQPSITIGGRIIASRKISCECGAELLYKTMLDISSQRIWKHVATANSILIGPGTDPRKQRILKCRTCRKLYELERPGSIVADLED